MNKLNELRFYADQSKWVLGKFGGLYMDLIAHGISSFLSLENSHKIAINMINIFTSNLKEVFENNLNNKIITGNLNSPKQIKYISNSGNIYYIQEDNSRRTKKNLGINYGFTQPIYILKYPETSSLKEEFETIRYYIKDLNKY